MIGSADAQLRPDTMPREYVVQRGDNLYRIALNHGTTVAAIQEINDLGGTVISVGQVLLLDRPEVVSGQAEAVDVTVEMDPTDEEPATADPDPDAPLFVEAFEDAQADESPVTGAADATPPTPVSTAMPSAKPAVEVVIDPVQATNAFDVTQAQSGDTFVSIAQRTRVPAGVLMALNPDLTPPLAEGAEVRLPIEPSALLYRVKDGDTIDAIASWFGVPADVIREVNSISTAVLRIDQELRIPLVAAPEPMTTTDSPPTTETSNDADGQTVSDTDATASGGGAANAAAGEDSPDVGEVVVTGTANVYPARFEGRLMAMGKPYDPKKFTVSHATLELGTVVLLTNDATGRKTFAEVTDRPPAGAQYLLDVSAAVAEVLGIGEDGTSVRMQVAR